MCQELFENFASFASEVRQTGVRASRSLQKLVVISMTLAVLVLAAQLAAFCQINTATLSGSVKDSTDATIPRASVVVLQVATGISRTVTANDSGFFNVSLLQPGDYKVTISKDGFKTATESIQLHVDQSATLDFVAGDRVRAGDSQRHHRNTRFANRKLCPWDRHRTE